MSDEDAAESVRKLFFQHARFHHFIKTCLRLANDLITNTSKPDYKYEEEAGEILLGKTLNLNPCNKGDVDDEKAWLSRLADFVRLSECEVKLTGTQKRYHI